MEVFIALFIGFLFAAATFCLLRRSLFRLVLGIMLLGQGANLLVFTSGGLTRGEPPVIPGSEELLSSAAADPLPQALVLTAIVIGFGVIAFTIALLHRAERSVGSDDLNQFNQTEGKP
ncbi:MAG: NADH-quinone oxidoreductase subunit K [Verrucomicrobiota bacterium]